MTITLFIGGARSGKSSLAVARALDWQRDGGESESESAHPLGGSALGDSQLGEGMGALTRHVVFVATGSAGDAEMAERIMRHRAERPVTWSTVDAPADLVSGLRTACSPGFLFSGHGAEALGSPRQPALIVDCVSMWVANHLMAPFDAFSEDQPSSAEGGGPVGEGPAIDWESAEAELLRQVDECFALLSNRAAPTWFVTNEVGLSLVPMSAMGRRYRDVLGRVNAKISLLADEAFLTLAGRVLRLERP
jgi:adenosyl cobinamide kinase/adenosyl cobinamide phosphate guanylyltransferase